MLITDYLKEQESMTEIEQSISQFFLDQGQKLKDLSSRKIAEKLYVSPSTITRFCQKLGYSGYDSFRKSFLKETDYLNSHFKNVSPNFPFNERDSDWHIANNIGHLYKETVTDTLELIHYEVLEKAHSLLNKSEYIYVYAGGDLIEPAYSFKNKMIRLGKRVQIIDRADLAYVTAAQKEEKVTFIIISYSGQTKEPLRLAKYLYKENIPIIALTSFGENTLSNLATVTLHLSSREKLVNNLGNFSSVLSTMYLLDVLYGCVFGNDYQKNYKQKINIAKNYEQYRHSDNPLLSD